MDQAQIRESPPATDRHPNHWAMYKYSVLFRDLKNGCPRVDQSATWLTASWFVGELSSKQIAEAEQMRCPNFPDIFGVKNWQYFGMSRTAYRQELLMSYYTVSQKKRCQFAPQSVNGLSSQQQHPRGCSASFCPFFHISATVQQSIQDRTIRGFISAILLNLSLRHCDSTFLFRDLSNINWFQ